MKRITKVGNFKWKEQLLLWKDSHGHTNAMKLMYVEDHSSHNIAGLPISSAEMTFLSVEAMEKLPVSSRSSWRIPGLLKMVDHIFGRDDRLNRLYYLSKSVGKTEPVQMIVWIYGLRVSADASFESNVDFLFKELDRHLGRSRCILIISSKLDECLKTKLIEMKFHSLVGVPYLVAGKLWTQRNVRFKMWFD